MRMTVPTPLGDLAVRCHGAPGSPSALLLLHANPGDGRDYDAVLPALADRYRTFVVDWPGYGDSTAPDPGLVTPEGLVRAAGLVLDALVAEHGVRRVVVLGNSVGGYVACRLAEGRHARTVSALVLVSPAGFTPRNALTRWFCRDVMGDPGRARRLVVPLARAYLGNLRTPSARETYARARQLPWDGRRMAVHSAIWRGLADPDFGLSAPGALRVPVLLLWGRRDPVVPALVDGRHARRRLPAHTVTVPLPTAHEPYNERPDLFLRHTLSFLKDPNLAVGAHRPR
ncbi:alpha/beta fold hydrolase [Streptomyces spongiae]|uniref:Alpha/beta hydrolase n=1 Tax=Streptomyces spongiae TaxID=565072 RepID=A0A5N8XHQ7_9ACTN|nr:alpha/beta fold hydrolase [Streptomyces spongiae]MPY58764.1 alpha/beta hydrolase [Streptomyces spongiae]